MKETTEELRKVLSEVIRKNNYNGLLFSGGLDTAILASLNPKIIGITVSLGSNARDIFYAKLLVKKLNMKHYHKIVEIDEALEAIPEVIKILKSFDPAIPNDLVVYFGLRTAKELGLNKIATGDGSDELFGGYSYMRDIENLKEYIEMISEKMEFSSNKIGDYFQIKIIQPFLDKKIIDFSLRISADLKIRKYKGKIWGKWILRKTFENLLPKEITWQDKRPLEFGSGMDRLREVISRKVCNKEFREDSHIKFISKDHFYYYKIYKKVVGDIPSPTAKQKICPNCRAGVDRDRFHCKVCGYNLDWKNL